MGHILKGIKKRLACLAAASAEGRALCFLMELLALFNAFGQEVLNLTVYGSEVVFGPACYVRPKRFGQT